MLDHDHLDPLYDAWGLARPKPGELAVLMRAAKAKKRAAKLAKKQKRRGTISTIAVPAGHAYVRASDQSEHILPTENVEKARAIDPALEVLHVAD